MNGINQRELMMLEASMFKLTKKCFPTCKLNNNNRLNLCMEKCIENYIESRTWLKKKLFKDYENINNKNEKIYSNYYK